MTSSRLKLLWKTFILSGFINTQYYQGEEKTSVQYIYHFTSSPMSFEDAPITDCKYVVIQGFLKQTCLVGGKKYFKCPLSDKFYLVKEGCEDQSFSSVCENDPYFYQSCGHFDCPSPLQSIGASPGSACGDIICEFPPYKPYGLGNVNASFYSRMFNKATYKNIVGRTSLINRHRCDGKSHCSNKINGTAVDEWNCGDKTTSFFCLPLNSSVRRQISLTSLQVCNKACDCSNCFDEANCSSSNIVGLNCRTITDPRLFQYLPPRDICDNKKHCISGIDEKICNTEESCDSIAFQYGYINILSRSLNSRNKCGVPDSDRNHIAYLVCENYRDQMNCTNSKISPLVCQVDGFTTTLSEYVICKNLGLCDDALDDKCGNVGKGCIIHKHKVCDEIIDCSGGVDEGEFFCGALVSAGNSCVRRMSYHKEATPFPAAWVMDGVKDCVNDVDEDSTEWHQKCGTGNQKIHDLGGKTSCDGIPMLQCPYSSNVLRFESICKDFSNCDSSLCVVSRQSYRSEIPIKKKYKSTRVLFYCMHGLETLQMMIGLCEPFVFMMNTNIIGKLDTQEILLNRYYVRKIDCYDLFGELYLYMTCTGLCQNFSKCPLVTLNQFSCMNYSPEQRVLTVTTAGSLTVILKRNDNTFHQDVFGCANDRCIEFHKVCDLVDDCGDASDEANCPNNFHCNSGEYVPLSRKCNSKFDCLDYSDECNAQCDNQVKIFHFSTLYSSAWIVGVSSIFLNSCVICKIIRDFSKIKTGVAVINNSLMLVITIGDLLQGTFLLLVAAADKYLNDSTCYTQFRWTTSKDCNFLGVISTVGSQVSLFSMTILSVFRARGTRSLSKPSEGMSKKSKVILAAEVFGIFALAIILAVVPLIDVTDDYFVRSLAYENNLLVGNLDKVQHELIIRAYYGRHIRMKPTWKLIKKLVGDMFVNIKVEGAQVGFYGSNGFCLFNYFVRDDNPQKWFVGIVMLINLACVLVIVISYTIVNASVQNSITIVGAANKAIIKRTRIIQRKVAILITTDVLSWMPFMAVTIVHYAELVDASNWHSFFSIILIPSNSLINPFLILENAFVVKIKGFVNIARTITFSWIKRPGHQTEIDGSTNLETEPVREMTK